MENGAENPPEQRDLFEDNHSELHNLFSDYENRLETLRKCNQQLAEANEVLAKRNQALEDQIVDQQISKNKAEIERISTIEDSRHIIKKLNAVLETSHTVRNALKRINIHFLPFPGNDYKITPGYLDPFFKSIESEQSRFEENAKHLNQSVLNLNHTRTELLISCCEFINQQRELMELDGLLGLCEFLPNAINNGKVEVFLRYKELTNNLCIQFTDLEKKHHEGLKQLITTYITSQMVIPDMSQHALDPRRNNE